MRNLVHHCHEFGPCGRDSTGQKEPLFVDWKLYEHPQLGMVEIGGLMETMHMNPMMETMGPIMEGCHASIVHHAKQHPLVAVVRTQAVMCICCRLDRNLKV